MAVWQRFAYDWVAAPPAPSLVTEGGDGTTTSVYTTASVSPGTGLLLLAVGTGHSLGGTVAPTVTGLGLTWTQVATQVGFNPNQRITVFRAQGTATPGTITITHSAAMDACTWSLGHFPGYATVAEAVSNNGTSSPATATLTGITSGNAVVGAMVANSTSGAITAGTGFTILGTSPTATTPSVRSALEYSLTGTNPVSFTTGSVDWGAIAVEIAPSGGQAPTTHEGIAVLTGAGALAAVGTAIITPTMLLQGAGGLVATGLRVLPASIALTGTGQLTATGLRAVLGSSALGGSGSLTAVPRVVAQGTAALAGIGGIAGSGGLLVGGAAALSALGTISASGGLLVGGQGVLSGGGNLAAVGRLIAAGKADLFATSTLTLAPTRITFPTVALTGAGTLGATGRLTMQGTVALAGAGSLAAQGLRVVPAAGTLSALGNLVAAGSRVLLAEAALLGEGTLNSTPYVIVNGEGALTGFGFMVGGQPGAKKKRDPFLIFMFE